MPKTRFTVVQCLPPLKTSLCLVGWAAVREGQAVATELNLNTLNWVTLTCPECASEIQVFEEDLAITTAIRCPGCGASVETTSDATPADDHQTKPDAKETRSDFQTEAWSMASTSPMESASALEDEICELIGALPDFELPCQTFDEADCGQEDDQRTFESDVEPESEFDLPDLAEDEDEETDCEQYVTVLLRFSQWLRQKRRQLTGTAVSVLVHVAIFGILALIVFQIGGLQEPSAIDAHFSGSKDNSVDDLTEIVADAVVIDPAPNQLDLSRVVRPQNDQAIQAGEGQLTEFEIDGPNGVAEAVTSEPKWQTPSGQGFEGRAAENRRQLAMLHGGSEKSEDAVEAGLEWLIRHQRPNGSWSFQHRVKTCPPSCSGVGRYDCPTGATGMALLGFLGAGYTHNEGSYQAEVDSALKWLVNQSCLGDLRFDLSREFPEGNSGFYAQGLASIALCEAYAMTKDPSLKQPAQDALDFISMAQDPVGGGWRYRFEDKGDTSVVGWQVMALVSGRMSDLQVSRRVRSQVMNFLENVHSPSKGTFGYVDRYRYTPATTSIGMLCTMYLDPTVGRRVIRPFIHKLSLTNPLYENLYGNYYTSQVLHHFGGDEWKPWNHKMRNSLVTSQKKSGHDAGSWLSRKKHDTHGGRLYSTCMSVLILEVYYRHLPLYQHEATLLSIPEVQPAQ